MSPARWIDCNLLSIVTPGGATYHHRVCLLSTSPDRPLWVKLVCSSALIGHRRTPRIQEAGLKNGQPPGQLARMLLQSFHKRRQQIDGKREDYSRILVGTDDCQRLQVAQLNRLRLLREYLRRLEQLFRGL